MEDSILEKMIYIFSGLGADERVFQRLDFSGFPVTFIRWEIPYKTETIENYASRLIRQITTSKPVLIGLSFGGIISIEIAKQIDTEKVILIASAKTKKEIPYYYRWAGTLRLHKLLPVQLLKRPNYISEQLFGTASSSERLLLQSILAGTNTAFLKWAIDKVVTWPNLTPLNNIRHIHGTKDRILPFRFVNCDLAVKDGGHFLTLNRAEEISQTLRAIL
jgi:pimeloyl-ACP methyl ester carboxylesterase